MADDERWSAIDTRLRHLDDAVAELSTRLGMLEGRGAAGAGTSGAATACDGGAAVATLPHVDLTQLAALAGRTLLVLGGAYLLRAFTESGLLPVSAGVLLGVAYAVGWLGAGDRAGGRGRGSSALAHGTASIVIALPLIWEASTRFGLLTPRESAAALALITALALVTAWHRRLPALAALAVTGAVLAAAALAIATARPLPFATLVVALAAAGWGLANARDWPWLRWPAAVAADLFVLWLVIKSSVPQSDLPMGPALALELLLVATPIAAAAVRSLSRGARLVPFDAFQTAAGLALGLGGAAATARAAGWGTGAIGALGLLIGAAAYRAAGAAIVARVPGARAFWASVGLVALLLGGALTLPILGFVVWSGTLAIGTSRLSDRPGWRLLLAHSVLYVLAAALASGLASRIAIAWIGPPSLLWPALSAPGWLALVTATICLHFAPAPEGAARGGVRLARLAFAVVVLVAGGAVVVSLLGRLLLSATPDAGAVATLRTAVLALAAVVLGAAPRWRVVADLSVLVYPVLVAGGLKLLAEDLRLSRASTLFLAFVLYGGALIVAPRIGRRRGTPAVSS